MARYNENECAHCAEDLEITHGLTHGLTNGLIGNDWKVYCCEACRAAGETASQQQWEQWQQRIPVRHRHAPVEATTGMGLLT